MNDEYFFVTLYVGATRKSMRFLLDTAASVTWVPELSCAGCKGAPRFERAASHYPKYLDFVIKISEFWALVARG